MKVGTDAVLLGAWCPVESAKRILDIGTGCGVIALMLAQRSSTDAHIDAVELEDRDARQASENVMNSPWPKKVNICQERIQDFQAPRYDLIVCNPPFFSQSLLPPDPQRARVRHDHELSREDLLKAVIGLLVPTGAFCLILPAQDATSFIISAKAAGLYLQKHTQFHSRNTKPAERSLLSFVRNPGPGLVDDLVLYGLDDRQTMAYRNLTGDFYL
jgi:tRNA1Val (adenine37-N6)-methyltransferase